MVGPMEDSGIEELLDWGPFGSTGVVASIGGGSIREGLLLRRREMMTLEIKLQQGRIRWLSNTSLRLRQHDGDGKVYQLDNDGDGRR